MKTEEQIRQDRNKTDIAIWKAFINDPAVKRKAKAEWKKFMKIFFNHP